VLSESSAPAACSPDDISGNEHFCFSFMRFVHLIFSLAFSSFNFCSYHFPMTCCLSTLYLHIFPYIFFRYLFRPLLFSISPLPGSN
jgi:hypothetical protein